MLKRFLAAVLCLLMLLSVLGCGQSGTVEAETVVEIEDKTAIQTETVMQNGVECYRVDGACYPAVFGEPQLTDEEITSLLASGDLVETAWAINTVPDCLRLLRARQNHCANIDNQDAETTILRGGTQPRGWVEAMMYLLTGDYEDSGRIDLFAEGNYYAFAAVKQDGQYYAFDPFRISGDKWLLYLPEGEYAATDVQTLADTLVKNCDYSPFTNGKYVANTIKLPNKDAWEHQKSFKYREYTDAEIQQLVSAGLTLEQAAEKLHTAEDAAVFLQQSRFHFDYSYNQNQFDANGWDWHWVLPADFTYEHMAGSCGGSSNLLNRLLAGDYDEQGYVEYLGAHIFNYIKQDGYYYFCDFINSRYLNRDCGQDYLMYVCKNPCDFVDYYCSNVFPEWDNPESDEYLMHMYLYPRDGKNALAIGSSGNYDYLGGGRNCDLICSEIEDTLIELYVREGYITRFIDFDSDANRPPVVNIPTDAES